VLWHTHTIAALQINIEFGLPGIAINKLQFHRFPGNWAHPIAGQSVYLASDNSIELSQVCYSTHNLLCNEINVIAKPQNAPTQQHKITCGRQTADQATDMASWLFSSRIWLALTV